MKLYGMVWKNWDLQPLQFHYFGFSLGGGLYVSTPLYDLRDESNKVYRCIQVSLSFMGLSVCVAIPLWEEANYEIMRW